MNDNELDQLDRRLGHQLARQRLGVEKDHESQVFGQGLTFLHIENARLLPIAIEAVLKVTGLYWRGKKNAAKVALRKNLVRMRQLPEAFDGFTILHLSDLHCELSDGAMGAVAELLMTTSYDVCVLTGDYRAQTFGPVEPCLHVISDLRSKIHGPVYGVLGNHDTVRMVPHLERLDVRMLMNEVVAIERGGGRIHLAGIDDAHFYRTDNIEKAAAQIPPDEYSILLSHTPEIYRQAAHAGFNLLLSGHTHGGQICLPGGTPITLSAMLPRRLGAGPWQHHSMFGYTSVGAGCSIVPARFNCPPEITLHRLESIS